MIHFVSLHRRIRQGAGLQHRLRQLLQPVPPPEQFLSLAAQFAGQLSGRGALSDTPQDQPHLRRAFLRSVQHGAGIGVEDPTTVPAAKIQHRVAVPTMHAVTVARVTVRTAQALRVQQTNQFLVTSLFIHQVREREVHSGSSLNQAQTESIQTPTFNRMLGHE